MHCSKDTADRKRRAKESLRRVANKLAQHAQCPEDDDKKTPINLPELMAAVIASEIGEDIEKLLGTTLTDGGKEKDQSNAGS
jgi:hypothetical protein